MNKGKGNTKRNAQNLGMKKPSVSTYNSHSKKHNSSMKKPNKEGVSTRKKAGATQTSMCTLLKPFHKKPSISVSSKSQEKRNRITETSKMENLRTKFYALVKKNALENKSNAIVKEDIHLMKNQVSVNQIKKLFLQTSSQSGKREEINGSITITRNSFTNSHGTFLTELLQTVVNRQTSNNEDLKDVGITKDLTCNKLDANQEEHNTFQQSVKALRNHFDRTNPSIVAYPFESELKHTQFTSESQQNQETWSEFRPTLYSFRLLTDTPVSKHQITARAPAFSILLDNFIAVIWGLLREDSLGVNALQWTYELLKVMKLKNGKSPQVVDKFIATIEDTLIESYAKIDVLKDSDDPFPSEDYLKTKSSTVSVSSKCNKWVTEMGLQKSYALREIVRRGKKSICKPSEEAKLVITSLIPTAILSTRKSSPKPVENRATSADCTIRETIKQSNCKNLNEVKNLLHAQRKTQELKLQRELCKLRKIHHYLVNVDDQFKPSFDVYRTDGCNVQSKEKLNGEFLSP